MVEALRKIQGTDPETFIKMVWGLKCCDDVLDFPVKTLYLKVIYREVSVPTSRIPFDFILLIRSVDCIF